MAKLKKERTRILSLSGTPFNLLDKYNENEIYTWDYVMEQRAKQEWDDKHFGDPNPYAELPQMQILTFTLPKMVREEAIENNEVFKFHEFFRVWTEEDKAKLQNSLKIETSEIRKAELQAMLNSFEVDKFVHESAVRNFVKKLRTKSRDSQYPFSTDEFRVNFRHTFWLLPGVKEAAAFEAILHEDPVFKRMFYVINAAGDGNIEDKDGSALADVENNIRGNKKLGINPKKYTITLSCGKLTTGVSVPEWTAVLCMKGSENTPAANYMQTIFRVQTHAVLDGRQKSDCYVFDFAPDRALTAVAEASKMSVYAQQEKGKKQYKLSQRKEEEHLVNFIKLCPVLSMDEGEMGQQFTANQIFEKLSNVYIERAVRSGYADNSLYNPEQLLSLTPEQEKALGDVSKLLGSLPASWKPEKIAINTNGLGNTNGADQMKYIYYLSAEDKVPSQPSMSDKLDENGCPTTDDDGWDDTMCAPTAIFPYLYVSNSRCVHGEWSNFSKPVLWKQWIDKDSTKTEDQKKREQENKEKRARMSVLRGVSIRIPLLVYGAEINDEAGEEITIDNITDDNIVDQASWEEFMPKDFTKETFILLKDCFDRSIFTGAAKRIRSMVKDADNLNTEDRIAKIAKIFSYFHNPDKETVLTPWKIVNRHMSDCLGGWCFLNEQFDDDYKVENDYHEIVNAARFVDRGKVTQEIFTNYNSRILEINSKTGLYPLYMAYSIFKSAKEPEWRKYQLTGERGHIKDAAQYMNQADNDLLIWRDVLQDNIFVVCRTKMAVSITKRTLAGFRKDVRMNVVCYTKPIDVNSLVEKKIIRKDDPNLKIENKTYSLDGQSSKECDIIDVLRVNPELFTSDVVKGIDFWHVYNSIPTSNNEDINNMRFTAIVGNPPYQLMDGGNGASDAAAPIYNKFVDSAQQINPHYLSMIMPSKWMVGGRTELATFLERMKNDVHLAYMKDFRDDRFIFPTAHNDGGICYFRWDAEKTDTNIDYNYVAMNGDVIPSNTIKNRFTSYVIRDTRVIPILEKIFPTQESLCETNRFSSIVSKTRPFGLRKDIFNNPEKYPDSGMSVMPFPDSVKIYGVIGKKGGAKRTDGYINKSIISDKYGAVKKWKIFFTTTYSSDAVIPPDLIRGYQNDVCTETFLLVGPFKSQKEMENCASYMESNFFRFLLFFGHGTMQVNQSVFSLIPNLDYSRHWSDKDLFEKFKLSPDEIRNIQNIIAPNTGL
jgi:hypothetical protein